MTPLPRLRATVALHARRLRCRYFCAGCEELRQRVAQLEASEAWWIAVAEERTQERDAARRRGDHWWGEHFKRAVFR